MPSKRRLVASEICFGTEKAGLLDFSYNKCALVSPYIYTITESALKIQALWARQNEVTNISTENAATIRQSFIWHLDYFSCLF